MNRNIQISYILAFCYNALFWTGIWLFYYLRFTDYQGIGLIETVWLVFSVVGEIPTGAIADLIGKKFNLMIAFFLKFLGQVVMGFSTQYHHLLIGVFILTIGSALHSGAFEALIYDSLKQIKKHKSYTQVLANTQTIGLIASAIASIIGGYLYKISPGYPYLLTGLLFLVGSVASFFLKEPIIDTQKFSLNTYINQTKQGFVQLFKPKYRKKIISFLIIASLLIIPYEFLTDALLINFGYKDHQLGIFFAILFVFSALFAQLAPKIQKKFGQAEAFYSSIFIYALILILSPKLGFIIGGLSVFARASIFQVANNFTSSAVNKVTESKYRATTLSTFSMLKTLPYALSAILIGKLMDIFTVQVFASYYGLLIGLATLYFFLQYLKTKKPNTFLTVS